MKTKRTAAVAAALLVAPLGFAGAAWATGTTQEGSDTVYAGAGWQRGQWSLSGKKLRLQVHPETGMSSNRCMDAYVDWHTSNGAHYDSRVVRSCRPGTAEYTDPDADGFWSEPSDWGDVPVDRVQRGWGYMIDDGNLAVIGAGERMDDSGTGALWNEAPGTGTQGYSRVRTRYEDGSVKSCNPIPVWSPHFGTAGCS